MKFTMTAATLRKQEQRQQAMHIYDEHVMFINDCLMKVKRNIHDSTILIEAFDKLRKEENYSTLTSLLDR